MKMVKSLILGSAAGLVAMSGAQAADLPVKAKAVEYVKICSLYGAGFYYIPGSDTCIKLGGYLQFSVGVNTNGIFTGNYSAPGGLGDRFSNAYTMRSRGDLEIDTRTATEYGVVRTFSQFVVSWSDDAQTASGTSVVSSAYSQIGASGFVQGANGSSALASYGTLGVYSNFIQFAGFTIGKALSPFEMPWSAYPGNNYDALVGGSNTVTGINQFIYTAQFGGGVSGTLGVLDPTQYLQAGNLNFTGIGIPSGIGAFGPAGNGDIAGTMVPDIVGTINVTQAWGAAQLSVAAHDNRAAYYIDSGAGNVVTGHPDDKWGFAVQGGLTINNVPTGVGDVINADAVYTNGATRYNISNLAAGAGAWTTFRGTSVPGALGTLGFGVAPDTVFGFGGQQQLISTWGGRAGYTHNWNPYWNTSIYGAYAAVSYGSAAAGGTNAASIVCTSVATTAAYAGITNCNPNYSVTQAGVITRWTPVKNLTFSAEYVYSHLSQNYTGTVATTGSYGTGTYVVGNQDTHQVLLRAQRNW
jgi:Porin subfamily